LKQAQTAAGVQEPKSPPARGRGLKPHWEAIAFAIPGSPPARGRGLKHGRAVPEHETAVVAPRAGAWIET